MQIRTSFDLKSEVEERSSEVKPGMKLYYTDAANFQKWKVLEVFDSGFTAISGNEEKDFFFNELQHGWKF